MWIKIMKDDLRVCRDCRQFCIKYSCFDDAVEDEEEFGICDDCVQQSLSSTARQHAQQCGAELGICRSCAEHMLVTALPTSQLAEFWGSDKKQHRLYIVPKEV